MTNYTNFRYEESRWGFQPVFGHEQYLYICEMPIEEVKYLLTDERTHEYVVASCDLKLLLCDQMLPFVTSFILEYLLRKVWPTPG